MAELDGADKAPLGSRLGRGGFLRLVSHKRSGAPVVTPTLFAAEGDRIYLVTDVVSAKVKRIRANARVEIAMCDSRGRAEGPELPGQARVLDGTEASTARSILWRKYPVRMRVREIMYALKRRSSVHIEVVSP